MCTHEVERARRARAGDERVGASLRWMLAAALVVFSHAAQGHGIAGNRVFPGTLAFDDPAVMDELIFPALTSLNHPDEGGSVTDSRIGWSFSRLLTSTISFGIEGGWTRRNWGVAQSAGFDTTVLTFKDLLYKSDVHELMISTALAWGIGHTGAQGVGANKPDLVQPGFFFGKGFGDLPDGLAWLRPFAITGAITLEHPLTGASINSGINEDTGALAAMLTRKSDTLHWGFSIQYSTFYLTPRYTPASFPPTSRFINSFR